MLSSLAFPVRILAKVVLMLSQSFFEVTGIDLMVYFA